MAGQKPGRILYRILFPYTALFAMTSVVAWLFSITLISHYLDHDLNRKVEKVAQVISRSAFIMNPVLLPQLKEIIQADVVLWNSSGHVLGSTFSGWQEEADFFKAFAPEGGEPSPAAREIFYLDRAYKVVSKPVSLSEHGLAFVSLWVSTEETAALEKKIIFIVGGITLLGIAAMAAAGLRIARSITAPVETLVQATGDIAAGGARRHVENSGPAEIGQLAEAFNTMIDQLQAYEVKLVQSEKLLAVGQIAAGLAHEVRNPLTSIKMFVQVLRGREDTPERSRKMLDLLGNEIDRLAMIIQQIVERARDTELRKESASLRALLDEVLAVAGENLRAAQIHWSVAVAEDVTDVAVDKEKIKQVFWNLILNAKDAMPQGGSLVITVGRREKDTIEVAFADTGSGLAELDQEKILQPFYTTKPEGMGLGLSMSRRIIEKHGGKLIFENRAAGGVRAALLLPVSA